MEDVNEDEPPEVITSDTENATQVRPDEAPPSKRRQFKKFRAYNTGTWNGPKRENKDVIHRQDNLHRFDSIASTLHLTDYQKQRGRRHLDDLELEELGLSADKVIFAICVIVANADCRDGTRYWPKPDAKREKGQGTFYNFAQSLEMDWREQMSVIKKVKTRLP